MAENTIKTRIQLKNDTEANWKKATNFAPKEGEVIIYSPDDTHPFSRLKVGHNNTKVNDLPFIESGSTNGFVLKETFAEFPAIGNQNCLYLEASTDTIYEWTNNSGYIIKYGLIRQTVTTINGWNAGIMTSLSLDGNTPTLLVINGTAPTLQTKILDVVTGVGPAT